MLPACLQLIALPLEGPILFYDVLPRLYEACTSDAAPVHTYALWKEELSSERKSNPPHHLRILGNPAGHQHTCTGVAETV